MEPKDVAEIMMNGDYKDKLIAEYYYARVRYNELIRMYDDLKCGKDMPASIWHIEHIIMQKQYMKDYIQFLEFRAKREGVNLDRLEYVGE